MDIFIVWFISGLQALVLLVVVQLVVTRLIRWVQDRRRNPERAMAEVKRLVTMWLFRSENNVSMVDCNAIIGAMQQAEAEAMASAITVL
ncbi:MAG: hypothetical protein H0X24_00850 [Ktedonobacterales bacterium]|nr:hypothetical protein [Ktedonobacterales bacterium]